MVDIGLPLHLNPPEQLEQLLANLKCQGLEHLIFYAISQIPHLDTMLHKLKSLELYWDSFDDDPQLFEEIPTTDPSKT